MIRTAFPLLLALVPLSLTIAPTAAAQEVAPSAELIRPILVGTELPNPTVETIDGVPTGLRDAMGGKASVLVVYRGGWCPFCNTQLSELQGVLPTLRELGVDLIAVSADDDERLRSTRDEHEVDITLLADFELRAAKALGLAFHVSDEYVGKLAEYGLDLSGNAVSSAQVLPVPAVFVVDARGVVTFTYVNPNYKVRCDRDVLLAAVRATVADSRAEEDR